MYAELMLLVLPWFLLLPSQRSGYCTVTEREERGGRERGERERQREKEREKCECASV